MEKFLINVCDSIGVMLTHNSFIVEEILNNLDNPELFTCKRVCTFWDEIAKKILSKRIVIINKNISSKLLRNAYLEGDFLQQLDFLKNQKFEYLVEIKLSSIISDVLAQSKKRKRGEYFEECNCDIKTRIAIFPSLPGIKVQRFIFDSELKKLGRDERKMQLEQLINLPKNELKFFLLFTSHPDFYDFPNLEVPSLIVYTPEDVPDSSSTKHCGFAFSGERMNVAMFQLVDYFPFKRTKSKFMRKIRKLNHSELVPFKCVALMFINHGCRYLLREDFPCWFEKKFPNVPLLLFNELYHATNKFFNDLLISDEDDDDDDDDTSSPSSYFNTCLNHSYYLTLTIVFIWFN